MTQRMNWSEYNVKMWLDSLGGRLADYIGTLVDTYFTQHSKYLKQDNGSDSPAPYSGDKVIMSYHSMYDVE